MVEVLGSFVEGGRHRIADPSKIMKDLDINPFHAFPKYTNTGTALESGSTFVLFETTPGTLILPETKVFTSALGSSRTVTLGWKAHTDEKGATVAASANGLLTSTNAENASRTRIILNEPMLFRGKAQLFITVGGGTLLQNAFVGIELHYARVTNFARP